MLSVIIPAYNENAVVYENMVALDKKLKEYFEDYEIVVVSDGSTDGTWDTVKEKLVPLGMVDAGYEKNLGKGGKAVNQNGLIYTDINIENLLFTRFIGKKERMAGNRTKGPKKRTAQNDADFLRALLSVLN